MLDISPRAIASRQPPQDAIPAFGLRHAMQVVQASPQPMAVLWGAESKLHFNDACRTVIGDRHVLAAGQPAAIAWSDFWQLAGHRVELALQGEASSMTGLRMEVMRGGHRETSRYDAVFSPLPGEAGSNGGVLCVFTEVASELAEQLESLTMLHDLAMRLGGTTEFVPALQAVLDTAVEVQGAQFGIVWLYDDESGTLLPRASRGFDEEALRNFDHVRPGPEGGGAGNAFARRSRWVIANTETDESFALYREGARLAGFGAVHSVPIITRSGALLGVISVHFRRPHVPSHLDRQATDMCARHAADAIEAHRNREALARSERNYRELDERKNEFLAVLAHELRNPLAPLRNGLEVLRIAGSNAAAAVKAREMMERQLQQMVRLVDDLLDVSRVSRGKIELRRENVELAAVLRSAIETSQPLMRERGHHFAVRMPVERIVVHGDATRLAQVFWNLLNNAARYTEPRGRIELDVSMRADKAVVTVSDNGIGIPKDMLSRVFESFTQVDRALEKTHGGLGIGLSLARRLAEMHDGSIEARSGGHGKGSTFTVRLPAQVVPASAAVPAAGAAPASKAALACKRILVADDNVDSATTLSIILEMLGNEVRVAHDGEQAVQMARDFGPDAILLDIGMPKLNGYQACERLRSTPETSRAYVVALTGWGQEEDRARARAAGFDHHIVKPVEPAALEALIASLPARAP